MCSRRGWVTKMHCLFSSAAITFASPLRGGKGGVFVNTKMHRLFPRGNGNRGLLLEEKVARNVTDEV